MPIPQNQSPCQPQYQTASSYGYPSLAFRTHRVGPGHHAHSASTNARRSGSSGLISPRDHQTDALFEYLAFLLHALILHGDIPAALSGDSMGDTPEPDGFTAGDQLLLPPTKVPPCDTGTVQCDLPPVGMHDKDPGPDDEQVGAGLRPGAGPPPGTNSSVIHDYSLEASIDLVYGVGH